MRIMITGAKGMLGRTLARFLFNHELRQVDIDKFDLADATATDEAVNNFRPHVVLHTAAMTDVDRCEAESDAAFCANAVASANIAAACHRAGARLVAFSTDYVFSGDLDRPYHEWDATRPLNVYGQSKLAGEEAVARHCPDHLIVRLAWLYGPGGGKSFFHTMLKLGAMDGDPLRVVNDHFGNPTTTDAVAAHIKVLLGVPVVGTIHLTCEGETTWYGFAKEIFTLWGLGREITACTAKEFPRPAKRPANSRLEKRMLRLAGLPPMPDWRDALRDFKSNHPEG